ncbi:MAG: trigger factor [Syntrophales bacterium]|nr:trigger factor [Syntrophales bacterium]
MSDISTAVKIEDISSVKKKLSFEIPWADVKSELDVVYRKVGKTAKVKGFRSGKIPRAILERYYREEAEDQTISSLVNRYYWETMQEKDIPAITQPQIEQKGIEQDKDFTFSATIEVEPVVDPKDYIGLELKREEPVVTEKDLEARLQEIRQMFATMEDLNDDRGVIKGDFVALDFTGKLAGESLKELTGENHLLEIGSKTFVPGFEDHLIGIRKGESKTFVVKFPEPYTAAHLAGKDVEFTVTVKGIRVKKAPEIDENFVKNFERYDSLEALKADVRKNLEEEKMRKVAADLDRDISEKLLACNDFEVPESFVERQIYYMMSDTQRRMVSKGMDPKKAAEFCFKLRDQLREEATKIVKTVILIKNIAQKEAITVDEGEVEKEIGEMASQRGQDSDILKKTLEKDDMIDSIKSEILSRKTHDFLVAKANITKVGAERTEILEGEK